MDFLRRLNPAHAALPSAARPVLAPRFAAQRARAEDTPAEAGRAFVAVLSQDEARPPREASLASAPPLRSVTRAAVEPSRSPPSVPEQAPRDAALPLRRPVHAGQVEAGWAPPKRSGPRIEATVAPVHAEVPLPPTRVPGPPANARPIGPATVARPTREQARASPLSPAAIAARLPPPAPTRTVVHVTIDRIDVRAPSAPASLPTHQRKPVQPSVSLADYLRPGRKGAA